MTPEKARALVTSINQHISTARIEALELYEDKGWIELGYKSWEECVTTEFTESRGHLYRLLDAAKVERNISGGQSPMGDLAADQQSKPIPERVLRPMRGLRADQQRQVWAEVTKNGHKPKAKDVEKAVRELKEQSPALPKPNKPRIETREARVARHRRRVELNGLPEVLAALDSGEIAPAMAETISNLPKEYQLAKLEKEKQRYAKKKKNPTSTPQGVDPPLDFRTGQPAKPEAQIPPHLLRGIITGDTLVRGHAVSSDLEGQPCALPIGVSKLERDECVATSIGGSRSFKDRKAYTKWETYHRENIREKVLQALEHMNPLEIPADFRLPPVTYEYNLGVACDLQELAEMLYADLSRMAGTLEVKEKYGHLFPKPTISAPS